MLIITNNVTYVVVHAHYIDTTDCIVFYSIKDNQIL